MKFSFSETLIEYTISRKTKTEPGMRNIKKNIETIFNRVNTIRLLSKCKDREIIHKDFSYKDIELEIDENGIIKITKKLIIPSDSSIGFDGHSTMPPLKVE